MYTRGDTSCESESSTECLWMRLGAGYTRACANYSNHPTRLPAWSTSPLTIAACPGALRCNHSYQNWQNQVYRRRRRSQMVVVRLMTRWRRTLNRRVTVSFSPVECPALTPLLHNYNCIPLMTQCIASSTPTSSLTWISWFCALPGHEYFCEVSEEFIEDDFNLTGLNSMVPFWKEAMEMVLDVEPGVLSLV